MCLCPRKLPIRKKDDNGVIHYDGYRIVACGKCSQCLIAKSNEWAYRCMEESKQYKDNCFVTLTYNDTFLPDNGSLCRRDLQLFIKRLRKHIYPKKVRFFYCGEYGKKGSRPHYHIILFGWKPSDLRFFEKDKRGQILFRSEEVERLWSFRFIDEDTGKADYAQYGFVSVGDVTFETARYCAKYLQKLQPAPPDCVPAFTGQSLKPGLGSNAIKPEILLNGGIFKDGKRISVPRYFMKKLEESHDLADYKDIRYKDFEHRINAENPYLIRKSDFFSKKS